MTVRALPAPTAQLTLDFEPGALLSPMTETMRADVLRILPMALDFFHALDEASHDPA